VSVEHEFAELVRAVRPQVVAVARRLVGPDEAEDVVQEALLRAFLGLSSLRDRSRFGAWLCGIAVNVAKMRLRSRAARERAAARAGNGAAAADESELHELVRDAVEILPRAQREVVLLHYVDDLSCDEIARALGTTAGAVRVRLHRARAQLRSQLVRKEKTAMIEMRIEDVLVRVAADDETQVAGEQRIVLLRDVEQERVLPIWIGAPEGDALAVRLRETTTQRPLTSDLMAELVRVLGGKVERVAVTALREKTFYGTVTVGGEELDARPSDAINLAVRTGAPIFVDEAVLEQAAAAPDALAEKLDEDAERAGYELRPGSWASLAGELLRPLHMPPGR
jgi:RNA polymerase sigma factor (sigma-70 family)